MKNKVKLLKVLFVSLVLMFFIGNYSYASEGVNLDSFTDIEDALAILENEPYGQTKSSEDPKTATPTPTSLSKDDIPETGSNTEIIFIAGTVLLLSAGFVLFKKQNIKLK